MGFADEAQSRIDQDLLMLESGIRTKALLRRLAVYKELVSSPSAQHEEFGQRYAERVRQASATPAGKSSYVPGSEVDGDQLRIFSERPIITGPLVCQLCESDFTTEEYFARHKKQDGQTCPAAKWNIERRGASGPPLFWAKWNTECAHPTLKFDFWIDQLQE